MFAQTLSVCDVRQREMVLAQQLMDALHSHRQARQPTHTQPADGCRRIPPTSTPTFSVPAASFKSSWSALRLESDKHGCSLLLGADKAESSVAIEVHRMWVQQLSEPE